MVRLCKPTAKSIAETAPAPIPTRDTRTRETPVTFRGWNYGDMYDAVARIVDPRQPALIHGNSQITWRDFDRRTNNLARALVARGARPDDKIAFYTRNHPAYMEG